MDVRGMEMTLGAVRAGVGAVMVLAPVRAGRIWIGPDAEGAGTRVIARALGAREVALGVGILAAARSGDRERAADLVRLGAVADAADLLATMMAVRNLQGARRSSVPAITALFSVVGTVTWQLSRREELALDGADAGLQGDAERNGIVDQQGAVLDQLEVDDRRHVAG